jgi:hypothetical protein
MVADDVTLDDGYPSVGLYGCFHYGSRYGCLYGCMYGCLSGSCYLIVAKRGVFFGEIFF